MEIRELELELIQRLDADRVLTDEKSMFPWAHDWTEGLPVKPGAVIFPKSTKEVSSVLKFLNENKIPVVPSGGRTGLAGGATASAFEVVLSLSKMNRILSLDNMSRVVEVEAGVLTESVQLEAEASGLYFPIDLASKGSSQIGGNIASNAGGVKFVRYGGMRENVLGLEVVLPSGEVLDLNSDLYKNNAGYDLKQIFIGSEGTLGVVTKAKLKLTNKPMDLSVTYLGFKNIRQLLDLLVFCHESSFVLSAFEFLTREALEKVKECFPQIKSHYLEGDYPFYALVETEGKFNEKSSDLESLWMKAFEKGLMEDIFLSSSASESKGVWSLRENITESLKTLCHVRKNDITISSSKMSSFFENIAKETKEISSLVQVVCFGHLADGNIHMNYVASKSLNFDVFKSESKKIEAFVLNKVILLKGSISAEHGIGVFKKEALKRTITPLELDFMKQVKSIFDPNSIMNPGKIFDLF